MGILSADHVRAHYKFSESIEFAGNCIIALANDPKAMEKSGHILLVQELAKEYGVFEEDGSKFARRIFSPTNLVFIFNPISIE
jgi:hypothetical protein